jgi:hypothetical protein
MGDVTARPPAPSTSAGRQGGHLENLARELRYARFAAVCAWRCSAVRTIGRNEATLAKPADMLEARTSVCEAERFIGLTLRR